MELNNSNYALQELTSLARGYAKGISIDKRSIRCRIITSKDDCLMRSTHVHKHGRMRGCICLEVGELSFPKRLQAWLILHEVIHLRTKKGHSTKLFNVIMSRYMPDHESRFKEYWEYRKSHAKEIRSFAMSNRTRKTVASKPTLEERRRKAQSKVKQFDSKIKRLSTLRKKWIRKEKLYTTLLAKS